MGGKRTDRISQRDLEVLDLIARFGVLPRELVARWARTGRAVTAARERRLREAGLIDVRPGIGGSGRVVVCRPRGLRAACREELGVPEPNPASFVHEVAAAHVAVGFELDGHRVLSEREIRAAERAEDKRIYSAQDSWGRFHRPDLVLLGEQPEAIEVELTAKSARRLDAILRAWRRTVAYRQFASVRYVCARRALPYVERSIKRTRVEVVRVEPLRGVDDLPEIGLPRLP
jgi:hypothetical protein